MRYTVIPATLTLCIGDVAMIPDVDVELELARADGRWHVETVLATSLDDHILRIRSAGIYEASGLWQQSPLAIAYWSAAATYLSTNESIIEMDIAADDISHAA